MGLFRSRRVVMSLVHAWSLTITVGSVIVATIVVVVVLLPLTAHHWFDALEPKAAVR